jgi:hypothetical protein
MQQTAIGADDMKRYRKDMSMKFTALLGLMLLGTLAGCGEENQYRFTKEEAKKCNQLQGEEVVECFGAEGPYAFTGGVQGNTNRAITFHVTIKGQKVKKTYPAEKNIFYSAVFFANRDGDGFAVVRKSKDPRE